MSSQPKRRMNKQWLCTTAGCNSRFTSQVNRDRHVLHKHTIPIPIQNMIDNLASAQLQPQGDPANDVDMSDTEGPAADPRRPTRTEYHPFLDGTPCDVDGYDLSEDTRATNVEECNDHNPYHPFDSKSQFELADLLYVRDEMSGRNIDDLIRILQGHYHSDQPIVENKEVLYALIDDIQDGNVPWDSFSVRYSGDRPQDGPIPPWMDQDHEVWFRDVGTAMENVLGNPELAAMMDFSPKRVFRDGKRQYNDFMSGNWAWNQADTIAHSDETTHGAMFVPVGLGSDKTTVTVATGQNDFYPLYGFPGNIHNTARRAHKNAVVLLGFLAIPRTSKEYADDATYRKFRRQLFHLSLERILQPLKQYMLKPKVIKCGDGHYRRVIYGIGPYIADYPEQALLACIVQGWCVKCTAPSDNLDGQDEHYVPRSHDHTDTALDAHTLDQLWDDYGIVGDTIPFTASFPRADIHELIAPDLLHQIIKGTFKDHLVDWAVAYIKRNHPGREGDEILADVDRRIAAAPSFPGLRHFYEGRGYKQWTGDDSKGLMKVFLPAIAGHVPAQMVHTIRCFLDFAYLVRRNVITEDDLRRLDQLVEQFQAYREIFRETGIREHFSLPRQHSMVHYRRLIQQFGAPNGLCSSITENRHIKDVKKPYRRSNRNKPLGQMLITNQRVDKLLSLQAKLRSKGLLNSPSIDHTQDARHAPAGNEPVEVVLQAVMPREGTRAMEAEAEPVDEEMGMGDVQLAKRPAPRRARTAAEIVAEDGRSSILPLPSLIRIHLHKELLGNHNLSTDDVDLNDCPVVPDLRIYTYPSARAVFFAPSDLCGVEGMKAERIRAVKSWYGKPRFDCVLVGKSEDEGFQGYFVARVLLLLSFRYQGVLHECALVHWFSTFGNTPCPDTGMWIVTPDYRVRQGTRVPVVDIIAIQSILRGVHLIGVAGNTFLPLRGLDHSTALDSFKAFYVNKYADHHSNEILF